MYSEWEENVPPSNMTLSAAAEVPLAGLHDPGRPDDRGHGVSAADDLAERRQVGPDPVERLEPGRAEAESGDDLVEDEQDAVPRRQLPGQREIFPGGREEPADPEERLDDEAGDPVAACGDDPAEVVAVVEAGDEGPPDDVVEQAGRFAALETLLAVVLDPFQEVGRGAVPAAADLQDQVAARQPLGEHDGVHRGQGPGGREADLGVAPADRLDETLGQLDLVAGLEARVERAPAEARGHPLPDEPGIVAEDVGVVALPEIDVVVAVDVPDQGAGGPGGEERVGLPQPDRMAAPLDHDLLGPAENRPAPGRPPGVFPDQKIAELVSVRHDASLFEPPFKPSFPAMSIRRLTGTVELR